MTAPSRVVIAAGGTGGHFYPGFVLAQTLRERGWQPVMLVRTGDPALPRLEAAGLPAVELDLQGLSRRPGPGWAVFLWKQLRAERLAGRILRDFGPRVVVGMGGYVTFPAAAAARLRRVPCAVHESNAVLGLANRAAMALGAKLLRGMPASGGQPAGLLTGTPVRPALWTQSPAAAARLKLGLAAETTTVLIFGGSQGARGLNERAPQALATAARSMREGLQVLHLAGSTEAPVVAAAYAQAAPGLHAKVLPYLNAMEDAYAAADLVVCRSGASTAAELASLRKPAVLVPFPRATAHHQDANAALLAAAGAARVAPESEPGSLAAALEDLLSSTGAAERRRGMSLAYDRLGLPSGEEAVRRLADAVEGMARP